MGKKKIKIVIDSNVFVNALLGGLSEKIFEKIDKGEVELVISEDIFAEYSALHEYPELKEKIDSLLFYLLLHEIDKKARFFEAREKLNMRRDEKDDKFLEVSYTGKVDCLITLDIDLKF